MWRKLYLEVCEHHSWRSYSFCTSEHCILRSPASAPPAISPCCTAGQLRQLIQRKIHPAKKKRLDVDHFLQTANDAVAWELLPGQGTGQKQTWGTARRETISSGVLLYWDWKSLSIILCLFRKAFNLLN